MQNLYQLVCLKSTHRDITDLMSNCLKTNIAFYFVQLDSLKEKYNNKLMSVVPVCLISQHIVVGAYTSVREWTCGLCVTCPVISMNQGATFSCFSTVYMQGGDLVVTLVQVHQEVCSVLTA